MTSKRANALPRKHLHGTQPGVISLDTLQHTLFAPALGQTFTIEDAKQAYPLILKEIRELGHRRPDATREPFALLFQGRPGLRVPQQVYRLNHPEIGTIEAFVTQVADSPEGTELEVIFN